MRGMLASVTAFASLLLLALLLGSWRTVLWRPRSLPGVDRPSPRLLGHRGVRGSLPENTVAALRFALEAGLDGVEVDVQRTRDGALVLWHDLDVAGRRLTDLTLAELRAVAPDAPELSELFALAREHPGTLLNLELKLAGRGMRSRGLERAVARAVRAAGLTDRVLVSSFQPLALARLRLVAPELRTALLFDPSLPRGLRGGETAGWLHVDALHPQHRLVTPELLRRARRRGLRVNTWTVNDADEVARVAALGVDGIIADDPAELRRAAAGAARGAGR